MRARARARAKARLRARARARARARTRATVTTTVSDNPFSALSLVSFSDSKTDYVYTTPSLPKMDADNIDKKTKKGTKDESLKSK